MDKIKFSEIMNLLLLVVVIVLIFKTTNDDTSLVTEKEQKTVVEVDSKLDQKEFVKLNDSLYQLPSPNRKGSVSIEETMQTRRSQRNYKDEPITIGQLSQVLWAAYGVTKPIDKPDFLQGGLKTAPSAGACYPLNVYVVVGKVKNLKPGFYKFVPKGHRLLKLGNEDLRVELCKAAMDQLMVKEAPVSIVYTAVFKRNTSKYGKRGRERYVCMDLGHSAENVYLQAGALGLGTCAIGAFYDKKISVLLELKEEDEPLYIMPLGYYNVELD